ncbi:hypothetical protein DY000_02038729 [Brassica cretica]|uniref:DUF4005 domain-containing protein n=1 Tax=Brassica cretica TaxID=69181 RepID=A0ABQ7BGJ3_BRACR|nr:hypothetical protein DY000_02038729 [Brassica cretica]
MYQENRWSSMSTPKPRPAAEKRHAHCPDPRKSLSPSKKPEEVEKLPPAKKYQGWTSTTSKHHYQATLRREVSTFKPEYASMSAHDLKPKKVTSSVLTPHKGAMRSSQTEKFQERPIPTLFMGSQGLQEPGLAARYISYSALKKNNVPVNDVVVPIIAVERQKANPYRRGFSVISRYGLAS